MSPPIASQSSAHTVHLQDLQHQISVKTLAFQTLQREYDSLLHKLERQRTKCAALEKKFEVSDIEINTLTEEKEKLLAQVAALEAHIEELQQSRDEARRQIAANGSQYMKIVEMANLLQSQSADEKRKWRAEKDELQKRIRILEEAMVTGFMPGEDGASGFVSAADEGEEQGHGLSSQSMSFHAGHTITLLRSEIVKLRARTQTLEKALQVMKEESLSIQAAAQGIVDSGKRTQEKFSSILES
jgi:chromosome segregation ATPase